MVYGQVLGDAHTLSKPEGTGRGKRRRRGQALTAEARHWILRESRHLDQPARVQEFGRARVYAPSAWSRMTMTRAGT